MLVNRDWNCSEITTDNTSGLAFINIIFGQIFYKRWIRFGIKKLVVHVDLVEYC